MKRVRGLAVVAVALGIWGGVRAWQSASLAEEIQAALAILIGGNLLLMAWLWYRARPGSGDRLVLPGLVWLSVSMLIFLLPKLLWPAADDIQVGASIVSMILTTVVVVVSVRRNRRLRRAGRPV